MGKERHGLEHGFPRSQIIHRKHREQANMARAELEEHLGEPSEAFFPPHQEEPDTIGYIVFDSSNGKTNGRVRVRRERETIATPQDVENRMRQQLETCVVVEHLGQMTPQWWRFKFNHIEEIVPLLD